MNVFKRSAFVCVLIAGLPGNATPVFGVASFQVLGILPPVGDGQADSSVALGVSADGSAVVGDSRWSQGVQAFRWTSAEGMTGLGDLPTGSFDSHARGASTNGNVVVGRGRSANGEEAFRWTSATGMVGLGALPSGGFTSDAVGVSADGGVVVGTSNRSSGEGQAFRWTASTGMVGLDGGSWTTLANGVSGSGSVVVGQRHSPGGGEAFMWSEASGIVGLGFLPGVTPQSTALGVSEDGSVVVGYSHRSPNGLEAFRWTSDTGMVGLGVLPGCDTSYALSVSADGQTIVGESRWQNGYRTAVIWDSVHGVRSLEEVLEQDHGLDLHGWSLINATAVSADGLTIVGQGVNPQNHWEAWRAVLPEPAALSLVIVGGLALSRRRGA